MQKILSLVLTTLVCGHLVACGSHGDNNPSRASQTQPPLKQTGTWFTAPDGRVSVLHGVAISYPQFAPDETTTDGQTQQSRKQAALYEDDAPFLVSEGFKIIRLPMFLSGLLPEPGVYHERYLEGYAELVEVLTDAGLYVVIDFHQDLYAQKYYGRGMPEWMAIDNGLFNSPDLGFPANYFTNVAMWRAYDNFWNNEPAIDGKPLQTHYAEAWQHVASRFKDNPGVLGYEFFNEPFPGSQWLTCLSPAGCPLFDQMQLTEFSRRMARAIREVDTEKVVFYEPNVTFDFGANTWHGDIQDDNAAFSFHIYCLGTQFGELPASDGLCENVGERPQFGYARNHVDQYQVATLLSEFGFFSGGPDSDSTPVIRRNTNMADEFMFNWTYWHYTGKSSDGIVINPALPPAGDNLKEDRFNEIVRSYPRMVAGTPIRWGFNPDSKHFELEYSTQRADGNGRFDETAITEIFVPSRHYPNGYEVVITNGSQVPSGDPQLVHVTAAVDAEEVFVTISPK